MASRVEGDCMGSSGGSVEEKQRTQPTCIEKPEKVFDVVRRGAGGQIRRCLRRRIDRFLRRLARRLARRLLGILRLVQLVFLTKHARSVDIQRRHSLQQHVQLHIRIAQQNRKPARHALRSLPLRRSLRQFQLLRRFEARHDLRKLAELAEFAGIIGVKAVGELQNGCQEDHTRLFAAMTIVLEVVEEIHDLAGLHSVEMSR